MRDNNKEAKKEELLEKQEAHKLTEEELKQVTGGATGGVKPFMGDQDFGFIDPKQVRVTTNYLISGDDD